MIDEAATACRRGRRRAKPQKLNLEVKIDSRSACERHVTVTIPREDIERYFDKEFSELMADGRTCPGFRAGRAPRKLVETRFRKDVADQVKGALLMDSLTQVTEDEKLLGDQRAGFRSDGGRDARRRADDVRVRPRSSARVRPAGVEGPEDREAGARVHRRRTSTSGWSRFWPAAAGWCRSTARPRRATTSPAI